MAKLIVCNWKENPKTLTEAVSLAKASDFKNVAIAAPFPFLGGVRAVVKKAALAAQDVSMESGGAFTGAVSASQLASVGVTYVIVGHSERRKAGDTDDTVAKKILASVEGGLTPVLCVGETHKEHAEGQSKTVIKRQLERALSLIIEKARIIICYEPVWAISTEENARPDTPENAVRMIGYIRDIVATTHKVLAVTYIYGGSVNVDNALGFLESPHIGGAIIGGASLRVADITKIIHIADTH